MHAVIRTGGKQYRVAPGDIIEVERLEAEPGSTVTFDDVLMLGEAVGTPTLAGKQVTGEVVAQGRGPRLTVFKKKRRKNYRRTQGHRQHLTRVRIGEIG